MYEEGWPTSDDRSCQEAFGVGMNRSSDERHRRPDCQARATAGRDQSDGARPAERLFQQVAAGSGFSKAKLDA